MCLFLYVGVGVQHLMVLFANETWSVISARLHILFRATSELVDQYSVVTQQTCFSALIYSQCMDEPHANLIIYT